jgi:6-phosphogluconolactonase
MKKMFLIIYSILLIVILISSCKNKTVRLFAGTYTVGGGKGFYLVDLDPGMEKFNLVSVSDAGPNPSYLCISQKRGLIYAANETMKFKGATGGGVTTLRMNDKNGSVEKINELSVPNGSPCYISLSPGDEFLFLANYVGGSITVVKLDNKGIPDKITDTILYEAEEGNVSHPHMISFNPAGKFVYVTDLGLDRIVIYNFNSVSGRLEQIQDGIVKLQKGAGPRHFVFSSDGKMMYVINELNSTISTFDVVTNGGLKLIQTITTLDEGFKGESFCADIHIGGNGEFLYGSNRGENSIVTFKVNSNGLLTLAGRTSCGGDWPRSFIIDPSGKYLLVGNQRSGNISLFTINKKTGILFNKGKDYKINSPACLKLSY